VNTRIGAGAHRLIPIALAALMLWSRSQLVVSPPGTVPAGLRRLPLPRYFVQDASCIVAGMRRLGGSIAWIQTLQYYGDDPARADWDMLSSRERFFRAREILSGRGHQNDHHVDDNMHGHSFIEPGRYVRLADFVRRVVRVDPTFSHAYFLGIGALAWNLERPEEALALIAEAERSLQHLRVDLNSDYWKLFLYKNAIIYKKGGRYLEMAAEIERIVQKGGAPHLLRAVLANTYKKAGEYEKAYHIWRALAATGDPEYVGRAKQQLPEIEVLMRERRHAQKQDHSH